MENYAHSMHLREGRRLVEMTLAYRSHLARAKKGKQKEEMDFEV